MPLVRFLQPFCPVEVSKGVTLLEAAHQAGIPYKTQCGGEGICGKCQMIIHHGGKEEPVLSCQTIVNEDLEVSIPQWKELSQRPAIETKSGDMDFADKDSRIPVVQKIYLELEEQTLLANSADHQLLCDSISPKLGDSSFQMGLKTIQSLPQILRNSDYKVTATVGLRRNISEIMLVEGGYHLTDNYLVAFDLGTTTIVAQLLNGYTGKVLDRVSCYNSQAIFGAEITARMIHSERKGIEPLQKSLVKDMNDLIGLLCDRNQMNRELINGLVCAGNTAICHFLLGLSTHNIRRKPFVPVTVETPPLRAAEVGLSIHSRGLLYILPGISGWVGGDLTAGIFSTAMHHSEEISLLVDIGTNGEVILGNRHWLIAASASAGPALEGASVQCGMRAEPGAVDRVYLYQGKISFGTINDEPPVGICGSGILDLITVLLESGIIDRSGRFIDHRKSYVLVEDCVYMTEKDLENIITAKAAIFSAINILLKKMSLHYHDLHCIYLAGAFGNYLNPGSAVSIGLLPPVSEEKIRFVGNTSLRGAAMAALDQDSYFQLSHIRELTTYYDLLGAADYVEEFQKALFLPHTDIDYWRQIA